ncbi:gliding motility protein RemB [Flavobacterium sp.]|jgi:hypothetical protein|uniref:gliding motility protein RemB n=1 Tax=Flavobacterium sp. TaxID=239 RepID=UPI0037BE78FF
MKKYLLLILLTFQFTLFAQENKSVEQLPVFSECENLNGNELEACFYNQVQQHVYSNFKVADNLTQNNYQGIIIVLFEVNEKGVFKVQYVDSNEADLIEEAKRVFGLFPTVQPPTFNGKPTYSKYTVRIGIPLINPAEIIAKIPLENQAKNNTSEKIKEKEFPEYDQIVYKKFNNPQFESRLNIPFSHSYYAQFDDEMNQVGTNNHTASKPYSYAEVSKYYNFAENNKKILVDASGWWSRKLWNENTVEIQSDDYWFTLNPILDLQMGKASGKNDKSTFINTRGIQVQGGLGKELNFTTTIYESQGRFADYFNRYSQSIKPSGGNPAVIPGIGIAKEFKTDAYDMPLAEANLTYTPSKMINLQLGYGRNFIGDGYRSLITTDGVSPNPYFKINTSFWKIKYTNTYTWLKDVRTDVTVDGTYSRKFMANHYLSWNATKRLNIGFFESVVWGNQNNRGFDMSFVNPIVFYRSVEFASSSKSGNALLGITSKYKCNNKINLYAQFLLDEFALGDVKKQDKSWRNKFAYQLGVKYYNAFGIENLLLQAEYNRVRPYVYSHSDPLTNYASVNQSLGHQWGANFSEFIVIARYHKGRIFADAKLTTGIRGFDFANSGANSNYGSDIYRDYDQDRSADTGVKIGQGNKTTVFIADIQAGYLINPSSNLKLFGSLIYRNFNPTVETAGVFKENTTWFSVGIRSDIFNWYFDY